MVSVCGSLCNLANKDGSEHEARTAASGVSRRVASPSSSVYFRLTTRLPLTVRLSNAFRVMESGPKSAHISTSTIQHCVCWIVLAHSPYWWVLLLFLSHAACAN